MSDEHEGDGAWTLDSLEHHLSKLIQTQIDGVKDALRTEVKGLHDLIDANDKRYEQRATDASTAVGAALNAAKLAVGDAREAQDKATVKQEQASEKRFDGVNEFRQSLNDQQRTMMPRLEAEALFKASAEKVSTISEFARKVSDEKAGAHSAWAYLLAIAGVLFGLGSFLVNLLLKK